MEKQVYRRIKKLLLDKSMDPVTRIQPLQTQTLNYVRQTMGSTRFQLAESAEFLDQCATNINIGRSLHAVVSIPGTDAVTLNVLARRPSDLPPTLLLERIVKRVYVTMKMFDIQRDSMVFWLVPCKASRWFPRSGKIMPKHINGGFTSVADSMDKNSVCEVFIYRYQEFPKVMLHETLHHSHVDEHSYMHTSSKADIERLKRICNIDPSTLFLPNEAVVEAWAVILHSMFVSLELGLASHNTLLNKEKEWGDRQARRLLSFIKPTRPWKEATNAYCYVVVKAALLHDAEEFIRVTLSGAETNTKGLAILRYVERALKDPDYIAVRAHVSRLTSNNFRMSVFGDL
jgi:hypothetical protein